MQRAGEPGGGATETTCDMDSSKGGAGGDGGPLLAEDGANGEPVANPPAGTGGAGQQSAPSCTVGQPGAAGKAGEYGLGAWGYGRLTVDGYVGLAGKDGAHGLTGQGGGGGGATFGKVAVCGAANPGGRRAARAVPADVAASPGPADRGAAGASPSPRSRKSRSGSSRVST